jgi:thioredoxin-dependent peroxiredoxin
MMIGKQAPHFVLKDGNGENWSLSDQLGKVVVLIFYPGDNTPVCTKQLCSVRDNWSDYKLSGAEVVGISTDSASSHKGFADKYNLTLRLLSDEKGEVVELYNVKSWIPGRSARAITVIDKLGKISYHKIESLSVFRPKDADVLAEIKKANG